MQPQRSRLANYGSNALNNSSFVDDPENYTIPTYSAFNGRTGGSSLLRDFHYQINSLRSSGGRQKDRSFSPKSVVNKNRHRRIATEVDKFPETESIFSQPDILDNFDPDKPKMLKSSQKYVEQKREYEKDMVKRKPQKNFFRQKNQEQNSELQRLRRRQRNIREPSLLDVSQYNSDLKSNSMTNDRILLELMNIKDRISLNQQLRAQQPYVLQQPQPQRSSALQNKMLEMLMKMSIQPQQQQPIIIQQPAQTISQPQPQPQPVYHPQPQPYLQAPRRQPSPPQNQSSRYIPPPYPAPTSHSYSHPPAPKKDMKSVRKRLRKVFWAVAFPFLLKRYSNKLIVVRKQYMINNLAQILVESTELIKEWFLKSSSKAISLLQNTTNTSLQFHIQQDLSLCDQPMKKLANVLDMILNSLQDTSKIDITNQFLPFISVTCDNRSFIHQNFITNKELQYIHFSQQHKYQFLDSNLQLIQIILFIFIKVIVYDILFQPQRIEQSWSKQPHETNLKLIGYILYYSTEELLNDKLKGVKPKGYTTVENKGVSSELEKKKVEQNLTWDRLTYLDGVKGIEYVERMKVWRGGEFWKNWKRQIGKIGAKLHKEMLAKRRVVDRVFKELEVKFEKGKESRIREKEEDD